ncbi:unnamed protein product [Haemonchus placei]|uniref:Ovule protein n=1 Tax=Haemonchus placei TaxID=6290 RepID=A0A0N4WQJ6_HAEPC|nr:unnamed protein product [Haemonchus placei]
METERFVGLPSCSDITWDVEYSNGTQSMCLDFFYEEDEVEKKGKLCCCRGQHKCNEKFLWGDESISEVSHSIDSTVHFVVADNRTRSKLR